MCGVLCMIHMQYNGRLCQFGAIGNLLHSIPDSSHFDVSRIITELILATGEKVVTVFRELSESYFGTVSIGHAHYNNRLMPQIALQLMERMSHNQKWETAFSIYSFLLTFGISYAMGSEDHSETHTSTISLIVEVCTKSNNTVVAVEVMRSCLWLSVGEQDDLKNRLLCAMNVGIHCISYNLLDEAIECIEAVSLFVDEQHHCSVMSFGNDVICSLLQMSQRNKAIKLCFKLIKANLCSRSTLSLMVHNLTDKHEVETARNLCSAACKTGIYETLTVNGDKFTLRLSPGLARFEIQWLLSMYLIKLQIEEVTCAVKILYVSGMYSSEEYLVCFITLNVTNRICRRRCTSYGVYESTTSS